MSANPEFRRNLWLEWSVHRAILIGGLLAGTFVVVSLVDPHGYGNIVANVALAGFALATILWGGHRAGDAIVEELRERTWDGQRMSALSPWSMTWGKLCGATIMPWYAGVICLGVYFTARHGVSMGTRLQIVLGLIGAAVLVQALCQIGALVGTRREKHGKSTLASWAAVGTFIGLWIYFSIYIKSSDVVVWFGASYNRFDFLTVSVILLAIWMLLGAYRLMCSELAVATRPLVWVAFLSYLTIFFAGAFIAPSWPIMRSLSVFAAAGLMVSAGATYISAFSLFRDPLTFRRLRSYAKAGDSGRLLEEIPVWLTSLLLTSGCALACAALTFVPRYSEQQIENIGLSAFVILLYTVRDILVLLYFSYGRSRHRVESSTIIVLALLYWLVPRILESGGLLEVSWLLRPPMWERPGLASLIIAVHVAIAGWICYRRYRERVAPG